MKKIHILIFSIILIPAINAHFDSSDSRLLKAGKVGLSAVAFRYGISPNTVRLAEAFNISLKKFGSYLKEAERLLKFNQKLELIEQKAAANQPLNKTEQNLRKMMHQFEAKTKELKKGLIQDEYYRIVGLIDHLQAVHDNPEIIDLAIKKIKEKLNPSINDK